MFKELYLDPVRSQLNGEQYAHLVDGKFGANNLDRTDFSDAPPSNIRTTKRPIGFSRSPANPLISFETGFQNFSLYDIYT